MADVIRGGILLWHIATAVDRRYQLGMYSTVLESTLTFSHVV